MTPDEFSAELQRTGFQELVVVEREPNGELDEHSHPFESRALILAGEITLNVAGRERTYRAGDSFHLLNGTLHTERYGPAGVRYLVGRR
jgi:quercetin dioxygenase-like cupin family protein